MDFAFVVLTRISGSVGKMSDLNRDAFSTPNPIPSDGTDSRYVIRDAPSLGSSLGKRRYFFFSATFDLS